MTDLDTALRTMLRERAGDIDTLPAHFTDLDDVEVLDTSRRHTVWLVAAAVAAVLAIVGTLYAIRPESTHRAPATTHSPSITHTTATPKTAHATRKIALSWFGMAALPGYQLGEEIAKPGYVQLGIRPDNDHELPAGCNGCANWTAYITVYDRGRFSLNTVTNRTTVSLASHPAYLGKATMYKDEPPVPTLAWQFAPDEWATVQGLTIATRTTTALQHVAAAVRPTVATPLRIPVRLGYLPAGLSITYAYRDLTGTYPTQLQLAGVNGSEFDITVYRASSIDHVFDTGHASRRIVDGVATYVADSGENAAALVAPNVVVELDMYGAGGIATTASHRQLLQILAGVTWPSRGLEPTAEQAIP